MLPHFVCSSSKDSCGDILRPPALLVRVGHWLLQGCSRDTLFAHIGHKTGAISESGLGRLTYGPSVD